MTNFYHYQRGSYIFYGWKLTNQHYVAEASK
jgi:hypothetical protein